MSKQERKFLKRLIGKGLTLYISRKGKLHPDPECKVPYYLTIHEYCELDEDLRKLIKTEQK